MLPYIIVFMLACLLAYISEKSLKKGNKKNGIFFLILAIIPLIVLAGLRIPELGYDMNLYGINTFNSASIRDYNTIIPYIQNIYKLEKGYILYVFMLTRICNNINFMMFGLQLIVSICFIIFSYHYKEKCSMTLMMFIYCCTLYAFSYNILRQSIALGIFLVSIIAFEKKRYILFIILLLIALQFHMSALFAILCPIIIKVIDSKNISYKGKWLIIVFSLFALIFSLAFYEKIIMFGYSIGLLAEKYAYYLNEASSDYRQEINIEYSILGLKTFCIILGLLYYNCKKVSKEEKKENLKWFTMLIIDYFVTFLSFKLANTDRITWYLYYPATFIFIPQTIKAFNTTGKNKMLSYIVVGSIFFIYILEKLITNQYQICPYQWIL